MPGRVVAYAGACHLEARLLDQVRALQEAARRDPVLLGAPVRLVVASQDLRRHLVRRIIRQFGGMLGLQVQTLRGLSEEIMHRAGAAVSGGAHLYGLVARQTARESADLAPELRRLDDGEGIAVASMTDLLNAGVHLGSTARLKRSLKRLASPERAHALALVEMAGQSMQRLSDCGAARPEDVLAMAARTLQDDPNLLPARAFLIHGFADAGACAAALLEALAADERTTLYLDLPPDPAQPEQLDAGVRFGRQWRRRMASVIPDATRLPQPEPPVAATAPALPDGAQMNLFGEADGAADQPSHASSPPLHLFCAAGADDEIREVAQRILAARREAPDLAWEDIAVVARTLDPYAIALRRQFAAFGIPFSGGQLSVELLPVWRRMQAALCILRQRSGGPAEQYLSALDPAKLGGEKNLPDLRLGLRSLGVARLRDLAALDCAAVIGPKGNVALPIRHGLSGGEEEDDRRDLQETQARRRLLDGQLLRDVVAAAGAAEEALLDWPDLAPLADHVRWVGAFLAEHLGWNAQVSADGGGAAWVEALDALQPRALAGEVQATRADVLTAFADALENTVAVPLGGQGGGVRVLDVMHARGLTFGRLFVVGLNRGAFPRRIAGDPLLPDAVRAALREALPLLPLKGEGLDEEHYLFAQLCASAEYVTLSWQYSDAEGRELSRSSLIERLLLHRGEDAVDRVASRRQERLRADLDADRVLTLSDHLQLAALSSGRRDLPKRLAAAFDGKAAAQHARARLDVLNEYDDTFAAGPSAYMGLVGAPVKNDPREAQLYVTTLESFARCPWKCFLEKVLRLEPSADPLRALPNPGSCVGDAVHKTLQRLVQAQAGAMGGSLSDALTREPVRVAPPAEASVRDVVHEVAARLATEEGIHLPLLHEALDRLVYERVQLVLDDWRGKAPEVIGVEVKGHVDVAVGDATVRIGFKADRVDRADGTVRLLDYKTGRKPRTSLAKALQTGLQLQLALYIRSIADDPADGAYVYLDTDGGCTTEVRFRKDSDMDVLDKVLEPLLRGWREGVFFPRVQEPPRDTEPGTCRYCDFAQACCRGDSGFRRRLAALAESGSEPLLGALWSLGRVADEASGVKA